MALGGIDPLFTEYNKITDYLVYFDDRYSLQFAVQLLRKSQNGTPINFHSEYKYYHQDYDKDVVNISRSYQYFLIIKDALDFKQSILIRPKDIPIMQYIFNNRLLPWFMGDVNTRVFELKDNELTQKINEEVEIPFSEISCIKFTPMVIEFADGSLKEGCRMYVNGYNSYVDMSLDKFMEFYYYICNCDFHNMALNMLTYVKSQPYGVNQNVRDARGASTYGASYFDKR